MENNIFMYGDKNILYDITGGCLLYDYMEIRERYICFDCHVECGSNYLLNHMICSAII